MQEPLREIFENVYEGTTGVHPMTAEEYRVWEYVEKMLGGNTIDELMHSQSRSIMEAQYDFFREGFRLGARLMLELK